jgi:hypothetical protein
MRVTMFNKQVYLCYQRHTPHARFDALQGQTRTYWIGALRSFAETSNIWQKTYNRINQYF